MTIEEYKTAEPKIKEFKLLQEKVTRYDHEKTLIDMGILTIVTPYTREIDFKNNKQLEEKVINAIVRVYEDEIARIEKEMNDIHF